MSDQNANNKNMTYDQARKIFGEAFESLDQLKEDFRILSCIDEECKHDFNHLEDEYNYFSIYREVQNKYDPKAKN